jgi:hypothetical protein
LSCKAISIKRRNNILVSFFLQYCIFYPHPASPFCYNIADIFPVFYTTVSLCAK